MTAAVMPEKIRLGHIQSKAVVKDAFEILGIKLLLFFIGCTDREERGRRHLLRITDDDGIPAPCKSTYSLAGLHL